MNEADFEAQKTRIRGLFDQWRDVLGLDEWEVTLNYRDGEYVRPDGAASNKALASTSVEWEYRRAIIDFRCDVMSAYDDDEVENCVVHEAMHILLNGQRPVSDSRNEVGREYERLFEEHTATTLARAFIRARKMEAPVGDTIP